MRVLIKNYGDCRVYSDRPFGYKKDISYHGMMAQKLSIQVCGIKKKEY